MSDSLLSGFLDNLSFADPQAWALLGVALLIAEVMTGLFLALAGALTAFLLAGLALLAPLDSLDWRSVAFAAAIFYVAAALFLRRVFGGRKRGAAEPADPNEY